MGLDCDRLGSSLLVADLMPRTPRIQFAGANYHVVTRGDGRRKLFNDAGHYERFTKGLHDEVQRSGWVVLAYCWMPNHIHALVQTPQPNLASGMQHWLSGYANWHAKRNGRTGHVAVYFNCSIVNYCNLLTGGYEQCLD